MTIHDEDTEALAAAALAETVASRLARLEADFRAGWAAAGNTSERLAVLDRLRVRLGEALAEPELAAARDFVEAGIDEVRPQLAASEVRPRVRLAAAQAAPAPPPAVATRLLIVRQRADAKDLLTYLCVVTDKTVAARFRLWPQSYPARAAEAAVVGEVRVYRGLYAYRLEPQGSGRVVQCDQRLDPKCARLDLMADDRRIFACDVNLGVCSRRTSDSGAFKGCPNSG